MISQKVAVAFIVIDTVVEGLSPKLNEKRSRVMSLYRHIASTDTFVRNRKERNELRSANMVRFRLKQ